MRSIAVNQITETVKNLCQEANFRLGEDVINALRQAEREEESAQGRMILKALLKNSELAREKNIPICQDTGFSVFFVELGQEVYISGGLLTEAINEGVRQGYREGYLRKSICDPFTRKNSGDNTPAVINMELVRGDRLKIIAAPKGGGSTNMSRVTMLKPADGIEGIKDYILKRASESGPNPCPPVIIGVGIGGSLEKVALLASRALVRPLGTKNPDPQLAEIEEELRERINNLGMGPQGLGGRIYTLGVHLEKFPTHIASLPLAINICCHASRHKEAVL